VRERLRSKEDRAHRGREPLVRDVRGVWDEHLTARVRQPDHGGVDLQLLDDGARDRRDRYVQRHALRERAGDLVERTKAPRSLTLRAQRGLEVGAEPRGPVVEARILDCDGELTGEGGEQRPVPFVRKPTTLRVRREQADRVVADDQR
jgi:hypothetical protein